MELKFDSGEVVEDNDFAALPDGEYPCIISESEMKETNAKTGKYLQLRLDIISGPYKNRVIFDRLNLQNPNDKAVEIAKKQLASLCRATGRLKIKDSSELHNIPVMARLKFKKGNGEWDDSNDVKKYLPFTEQAQQSKPFAASNTDDVPW